MNNVRNITRGALFIALGIVIPFALHAISGPALGRVFLPMHLTVLLSGFFCGPAVGLLVGLLTPLISSLFTGMPPLVPMAQMMAVELALYGGIAGAFYHRYSWSTYPALIIAMLGGRLAYGLLGYLVLPLFGLAQVALFYPLTYGIITALPGIALQLVLIPLIVYLLRTHIKSDRGRISSG